MPIPQIFPTSPECFAVIAANFRLVVPLSVACFAIIIVLPFAAARSRLHIPGYVGLAFLGFILGLVCGRISGVRGVSGTPTGVLLSLILGRQIRARPSGQDAWSSAFLAEPTISEVTALANALLRLQSPHR